MISPYISEHRKLIIDEKGIYNLKMPFHLIDKIKDLLYNNLIQEFSHQKEQEGREFISSFFEGLQKKSFQYGKCNKKGHALKNNCSQLYFKDSGMIENI